MKIKVAADFTRTPGHRSPDDGLFSGELFLKDILSPVFQDCYNLNDLLFVDLDGTAGYATSFLEASFGGLARIYPIDEVLKRIRIICVSEPYLVEEVDAYIKEARNKKANEHAHA